MSYNFYNYVAPNYWDLELYQRHKYLSFMEMVRRCMNDEDDSCFDSYKPVKQIYQKPDEPPHEPQPEYDITESINDYNKFLNKYVDEVNAIIDKYASLNMESDDPVVSDWIKQIKSQLRIGKLKKLEKKELKIESTKLPEDEYITVLKMIRDDMISKRNYLDSIHKIIKKTPMEIYEDVFHK